MTFCTKTNGMKLMAKYKLHYLLWIICLSVTQHALSQEKIDTNATIVVEKNQEAEIAYNRGIKNFNNKEYQAAIVNFSEAIKYKSNFAKAYK